MGNNKYKILIVEDEANIRSFIKANLETSDYQVLCAETCALGMMMYASHHPDLIVLDLGLPDRDGMSLIQEVRKTDTVPIIVLSARSNERDKVEALDLGANDYITKPFGTEELLARIRAVLRSHRHSEEKESSPGGKFRLQDLLIDYDTRQVFVGKEEIDLTQTEYNIMVFLSVHDLIVGRYGISDMSGPIGAVSVVSTAVKTSVYSMLRIMALLTINVGLFNLFPIPALDGWRLFVLIGEGVTGKKLPQKAEYLINAVGLAALLALMCFVTFSDITKFF